jgi:hypothetical protein
MGEEERSSKQASIKSRARGGLDWTTPVEEKLTEADRCSEIPSTQVWI